MALYEDPTGPQAEYDKLHFPEHKYETEEPYDASEEEAIAKATTNAKLNREAELDVIRKVMITEAGRRWLYGYLSLKCHVFAASRLYGSDLVELARCNGERDIGLLLQEDIMAAAPEYYMQMCTENSSYKA